MTHKLVKASFLTFLLAATGIIIYVTSHTVTTISKLDNTKDIIKFGEKPNE